ncbi:GIY-YIG nuclease family protein [Pseudogracilibacillus auburnensis]|uniref:GIY-YIG nuclease family protein n=1 Tax=Pseudogracilibacillus auburnensis TaxID=1494959 RepID=UPI001A9685A0|nr:GIY-YIG nuclease family protein [Pseudogracilibacillus auburnensis]MBO1004739.1 GIY-YIG nuclease family protein [Pseudogracilibacillus auburnensis]
MAMNNNHYFYVLECKDGSFYGGYTTDLKRRLDEHNRGKGAKYTRMKKPVSLIFSKKFDSKSGAMQAEYAFKQLTRSKKEKFLQEAGERDAESEKL